MNLKIITRKGIDMKDIFHIKKNNNCTDMD
jgi:hypothetical protein